ncbi:hypothetical protein NFHSH190041_24230 [Shewanella sp. NFH-SH190041]|uniref:hypothetical protein n=1 Tax=Shewanella sp. NFH-SH190041 TaxID=2950245 RepID=UPI0021C3A7DD|nr:hypothetical protein [Shewanella sp. NFH-SH190041]BDM64971.1 hypothetical protein NFHSH190041_24230 [Shewanella sp. NFH-SH190041]
MTREIKTLLLNTFVCPGSGHLWLGKKWAGWSMIIITIISLLFILSDVISLSQQVSQQLLNGTIPLDFMAILAEIENKTLSLNGLKLSLLLLISAWTVSILDSIRMLMIKTK